uniref:NADH dehydrogenase subunit 6 n=1 Tax=Panagrolaimus sp. ES5 TaxID=591445 RepID=A0AC34FY10_9BILA
MLIPALPLGFFGFALSFYCNLKLRVPYIFYKRVEYFSLFPTYAALGMSLSSYILYFISVNPQIPFKHEVIATHSAIVLGGILILIGFISFRKNVFFCAFLSLSFAAFAYVKISATIAFSWIQGSPSDGLKGDYYVVAFHIYTIVAFVLIGMIMCFYAAKTKSLNPQQKLPAKHKIYIINNDNIVLPITVCQKC